jgi:DNA-binding transcriptional LysR family regulator
MLTFKQLEAVHWVARLGSFAAAADKLHTTQSAISKRLAEIESLLGIQLFDRSRRTARLTDQGQEVLALGEEILQMRERLMASVGKEAISIKRFRIGVTELTALTWLPRFAQAFKELYPQVQLEPEIDLSANLCEKLEKGSTDFIVVPPVFNHLNLTSVRLQDLSLVWMCSPDLYRGRGPLTLEQITAFPVLMQIERSGVDMNYEKWFQEEGLTIQRVYSGNSLIALSALTMLGFGVSFLPEAYFSDLVKSRQLRVLQSVSALPKVPYYAVFQKDGSTAFNQSVAALAKELCNFSKPQPTPRAKKAAPANRSR